jgi:hypothetical protein
MEPPAEGEAILLLLVLNFGAEADAEVLLRYVEVVTLEKVPEAAVEVLEWVHVEVLVVMAEVQVANGGW